MRNITACPYAGVASDERFDVTPYAEALTRYLLRHPLSSTLPRKFKIAFEGCPVDHIAAAINDLGFSALTGVHGSRGFRVTAGGGTAIMTRSGGLIHEWLPASEILRVAEAVLRVFRRLGDYEHKQRNRIKFLIKALGWDRWREEYDRELALCRLGDEVPALSRERSSSSRPTRLRAGCLTCGDERPLIETRPSRPTARQRELRLVPWNRDGLYKSRSAAPGSQGATTENFGHI
ncbi:MAG: hypothetical protein ACRD26_06390 [Vicinamibacterales bacterium]